MPHPDLRPPRLSAFSASLRYLLPSRPPEPTFPISIFPFPFPTRPLYPFRSPCTSNPLTALPPPLTIVSLRSPRLDAPTREARSVFHRRGSGRRRIGVRR